MFKKQWNGSPRRRKHDEARRTDSAFSCGIWLFEREVTPCIPPKSNRKNPLPYRRSSYRKRHLVEHFFGHLKTFRRVATRYDKLAETFFGWVLLAVIVKFGK